MEKEGDSLVPWVLLIINFLHPEDLCTELRQKMRENNDFVLKRDTINLLQARPHYIISYTDIKSHFQKKDIFPKD